jgi:hypothetical protein
MIIVIDNLDYGFHFEIIESVIQKYDTIIKIQNDQNNKIYLENIASNEYIRYINKNYPNILINKKIDNYDYKIFSTFYSKEFDKYMDKINDWKDAAVMIFKVISNPELMKNFSNDFWKKFKLNTLDNFYEFLKKIGAGSFIPTVQKIIDSVTNLDGWKKFLASTAVASIIKYAMDKLKNLAPDKIKSFIGNYLSESILGTIVSKLTDFKSYLGFLEPIIGGVQFFYDILKPTLDKFRQALQFTLPQSDTATSPAT